MRNFIITALLALFSINCVASAEEDDIFEIEAEGSYRMEAGSTIDPAKELALFIAKRKAVDLAGRYLARKGLINIYELEKEEIYSLTARGIKVKILKEQREKAGKDSIYHVRIRAWIQPSDFIKAEMEDIKQEKKETKESYREEMEQYISAEIDPGREIAKAYRLLRQKKWRIAMIYLNHLGKKYPNWDSIYMAKAITHFVLHEPLFMKQALNEACRLDNQIACDDLRNLKRVHEHDFGLSILD
jgi:hypothetical protein